MRRSLAAVVVVGLLGGCRAPESPPLAPSSGSGGSDGGAADDTFPEVKAADRDELDASVASKPEVKEPAAPATPEPKDECTPVGVDFEKRARPRLKDCYAAGKKKDPNLAGTVRIGVDIDTRGVVKSVKVLDKTLPDPVAACMLKVVKTTPLPDAARCPGKSLTLPVTFPTPR
jgi:hypothetical protein